MIKNARNILAALLLAASAFGAGAVFTAGAHAQTASATANPTITTRRTQWGSAYNLRHVRRRLEGIIDQLQRDQNDYGGHRIKAIQDLTQARTEIDAALHYKH